jgi:predicted PurR-regulated permease PerM
VSTSPDNRNIIISNGTIVRVILFGLLLFALYKLSTIVLTVLTAVVIASFAEAAVRRFARIGVGRSLAVVLVYTIFIILLAGLFYLFVPMLVNETSHIVDLLTKYLPSQELLDKLQVGTVTDATTIVDKISHSSSLADFAMSTKSFVKSVSGSFFDAITSIFGGILNVALIAIISFYLSIQEGGIQKFLRIITPAKNEKYIIDLWNRTQRKIALWLKGQLILGLIVGVLIFIVLSIFGLPYALLLALATAVFELIPFGVTLAMVPATGIAYVEGGITLAALVLASYVVIQQIENYVLQPLVVKKIVGISPLVVILSVLIGFELAGFWGLILAVPVAVALLEYVDDLEKKRVAFEDGK